MDLSTYDFGEITEGQIVFSNLRTDKVLLTEAMKRKPEKGIKEFNRLFFSGGNIVLQNGASNDWRYDAFLYAKALMASFEPKHEHKEVIVGMLLEECLSL